MRSALWPSRRWANKPHFRTSTARDSTLLRRPRLPCKLLLGTPEAKWCQMRCPDGETCSEWTRQTQYLDVSTQEGNGRCVFPWEMGIKAKRYTYIYWSALSSAEAHIWIIDQFGDGACSSQGQHITTSHMSHLKWPPKGLEPKTFLQRG